MAFRISDLTFGILLASTAPGLAQQPLAFPGSASAPLVPDRSSQTPAASPYSGLTPKHFGLPKALLPSRPARSTAFSESSFSPPDDELTQPPSFDLRRDRLLSSPTPFLDSNFNLPGTDDGMHSPPSRFAAPPSPYTPALRAPAAVPLGRSHSSSSHSALQWGPFRLLPSLAYRFSYSTGLPSGGAASTDAATIQHSVTPSLRLESPHLVLGYNPSLKYYQKGRYEDSVDQAAFLRANFGYGDWRFGISQSYSFASQVLVETARQTETESFSTGLSARYHLSDRTSLDLTASQAINQSSGKFGGLSLNNSKTWSTMNWVDYAVTDRTRLGVGLGGGYVAVQQGADNTYEQIQARVAWAPRPKISASLNGGLEIRQFLGSDASSDRVNPVMGASVSYRPFNYTGVSLSANRGVGSSVFTDQITETTTFSLALSQRLVERLQAGLSVGLRSSDYQSSSRNLSVDRSDNSTFIIASLSTMFFKRASTSVSYSHTSNNSSQNNFTYDSDTFAFQIGYSF